MSWGDFGNDWLKNGLPVFDGGKDKTLARKAIDKLGGPGSFRTEITAMPDGTTVITQTKWTMPPQIRITGNIQPYVERTFVFNEAGSTVAMIANRAGATMRRVRYPYTVVPAVSYKVGPINTSGNAQHWNDVWRLDSIKFVVNAKAPKTGPTTVDYAVAGGAGAPVPWLTSYVPPTHGDGDRTALFLGATEGNDYGGNPFGVSGATFDGTAIDLTTPPTLGDTYFQANALGVRVDAAGNFHFYWIGTASTFVTHHAIFAPSYGGAPTLVANTAENSGWTNGMVITVSASGNNSGPVYGVKESCTFDAHYSWLDDGVDYYYHYGTEYVDKTAKGYYGTSLETNTSQVSHHNSFPFYSDSPFPATLTIDITGSEQWQSFSSGVPQAINAAFPPQSVWSVGSEGAWIEWVRSSETTLSFLAEGLAPLYLAHSTVNSTAYSRNTHTETITYTPPPPLVHSIIALYMGPDDNWAERFLIILAQKDIIGRDRYGNYHAPIDSSSQRIVVSNVDNSVNRTDTITLHLESNDYLFIDVDEGISLRLNAVYDYEKTHVDPGWGQPITLQPMYGNPDVSRLTVKYILDVRGVIKEFVMYDGTFTEPYIQFGNTKGERDSEPVFHGYHAPGTNILPILTAIMEQGKCAWIAYTTKAEEAAGATPEFYIDALVLPDIYATRHGMARNNPWTFRPLMLNSLFTNYLGKYADTRDTGFFYGTLYGTPMRIQYATGLSNPWPEKLGAPFTADSHVEISRI